MTDQVALYLRVSTVKQAEKDLSIPDQRLQAEVYCRQKGWNVVTEYVEPGASATDDKRPVFQKMIDAACSADKPYDVILVHSFSRFFRDAFQCEFYVRRLAKAGVRLVSITQDIGDDPTSQFIRQIMTLFDEYQSKENAKHTLRAMKENARQGFWNGSRPPIGYKVVESEKRGDRVKKRLEIDPNEAEIVRMIFRLYLHGEGLKGPMGIKSIATYLNERGYQQRTGTKFSAKTVHEILRRSTYAGRHFFNQFDSKTRKQKHRDEWIECKVPAIVDGKTFDDVQRLLKSRSPKNTPPRVVNGPTLLTGLAKCASCGGGMTLRTGKGGRYRYYSCSTCLRQGKTACKGRNVPMGLLDDLVTDQLLSRVLAPQRVKTLLAQLNKRDSESNEKRQQERKTLKAELNDTDTKLERLYEAVETGTVPNSESFHNRITGLDQRRDELLRLLGMADHRIEISPAQVTKKQLNKFSAAISSMLKSGEPEFRKAYVRLFVDRIEVDDEEVRIWGSKEALANAITKPNAGVPSFMEGWRPRQDSNLQPQD